MNTTSYGFTAFCAFFFAISVANSSTTKLGTITWFKSPFINVVQVKDYITNPKESGYRAYHIIVEVPVELSIKTIPVRCEIQVRTLLMDAWSSLEHETVYKNPNCSDESKSYLRDYSYLLADMDERMLNIKRFEVDNLLKHNEETNENVKTLSKIPKKG